MVRSGDSKTQATLSYRGLGKRVNEKGGEAYTLRPPNWIAKKLPGPADS